MALLRRWLYTPIIIWQGDWIPREPNGPHSHWISCFFRPRKTTPRSSASWKPRPGIRTLSISLASLQSSAEVASVCQTPKKKTGKKKLPEKFQKKSMNLWAKFMNAWTWNMWAISDLLDTSSNTSTYQPPRGTRSVGSPGIHWRTCTWRCFNWNPGTRCSMNC